MELQADLKEFLGLFLSRRVEFLVVGAHALAFHGHPRFTGDIDYLIRTERENAERVEAACADFGFRGSPFIASEFVLRGQVFQLGRPPHRIDLLTSITGVPTEDAWDHRVKGTLGGFEVYFISKDDLIANKRATGRAQDLADVEVLLKR